MRSCTRQGRVTSTLTLQPINATSLQPPRTLWPPPTSSSELRVMSDLQTSPTRALTKWSAEGLSCLSWKQVASRISSLSIGSNPTFAKRILSLLLRAARLQTARPPGPLQLRLVLLLSTQKRIFQQSRAFQNERRARSCKLKRGHWSRQL